MDARDQQEGGQRAPATQFDMILAVARERMADTHLEGAITFIERTGPYMAPPRALAIYSRVHEFTEDEFRLVRNRVLATLATTSESEPGTVAFVGINGDVEWDVTASMLHRIRRRLGGRRNFELRRWVEMHTGHIRSEVLRIHVDAVCQLVANLEPNRPVSDAVREYTRSIGARRELQDAVYQAVLDRLYRDTGHTLLAPPRQGSEPEQAREDVTPLRVVADA